MSWLDQMQRAKVLNQKINWKKSLNKIENKFFRRELSYSMIVFDSMHDAKLNQITRSPVAASINNLFPTDDAYDDPVHDPRQEFLEPFRKHSVVTMTKLSILAPSRLAYWKVPLQMTSAAHYIMDVLPLQVLRILVA